MQYKGFLTRAWSLKNEVMVKELMEGPGNQWDNTVCGHLNLWTTQMWAETYNFVQQGLDWATRTDEFVRGKFVGKINLKDGYVVDKCKDPRERQVLAFLI